MKKTFLALAVTAVAAIGASTAHAGVAFAYSAPCPVVSYRYPAPVCAPPVYVAPAPEICAPVCVAPVVYGRERVVVRAPEVRIDYRPFVHHERRLW